MTAMASEILYTVHEILNDIEDKAASELAKGQSHDMQVAYHTQMTLVKAFRVVFEKRLQEFN